MLFAISQLIQTFWGICTFKKGPEDLPLNHSLLGITLVLVLVLTLVLNYYAQQYIPNLVVPVGENEGQTVVKLDTELTANWLLPTLDTVFALALSFALVYGIMSIAQKKERAYKTFFALQGSSLVFYSIGLAIIAIVLFIASLDSQAVKLIFGVVTALVGIGIGIWGIFVTAHIFRRALEITLLQGCGVTIVLAILSGLIGWLITPSGLIGA